MLNRLVLRVPLKYQNLLIRCVQYSFCYIQAQKPIDRSKASIRLMLEPLKLNFSLQILKQAKLSGQNSFGKNFYLNNNNLSLGELSATFVKGCYHIMQNSMMMKVSLNKLFSSFQKMDDSLQLHLERNLADFLVFIETIETRTNHNVTRIYLAFLAAYFIRNPQMKDEHKNIIVEFLSGRAYIFEQMLKYVSSIDVDDDKILKQIIQQGDVSKIRNYFENNAYKLRTILNLENLKNQNQIRTGSQVINQQKKEKLIDLYFKMLQNKQILPLLLNINKIQLLFLDPLFQHKKNRDRFANIFSNAFAPSVYCCFRTFQNFQMYIFDRLYTYYNLQQRPSVVKVLTSYQQCALITVNNKTSKRINYGSLISLCHKHKHYSKTLIKIIINKYIQFGANIKDYYLSSSIIKEKILIKNEHLIFANHLIILFKILNQNTNQLIPRTLIDTFKRYVNYIYQNFIDCGGISVALRQTNIEQLRENFQRKSNRYSKYFQLEVIRNHMIKIKNLTQQIQTKFKISCNEQVLKRNSYPINLNNHNGVRLKLLFNILNYHSEMLGNTNYLQNFYKKVNSSSNLVNMIKKHISFPGLLQSVYYFYEFYFYHLKNTQVIQILQALEPQRAKISKKIMETINQQKSYQKKYLKIQYMHNIENLSVPIRVPPNFYSKISQHLGLNYSLIHQFYESKQIREKFKTFLFSFAKAHQNKINISFPHIEYPFIADYLILTFDQRIAVLIVPPLKKKIINATNQGEIPIEQFESIERIFEQNEQKRQKRTKKFFVNSNQINYNYFKKKNKVILISCEEDIQKAKNILQQIVSK